MEDDQETLNLETYVDGLVDEVVSSELASDHGIDPEFLDAPFDFGLFKVVRDQDETQAADFAEKVMQQDENDEWKRVVFFTDGSTKWHQENRLSGAGVAYKICCGIHSNWIYSSAAIIGKCDSGMAELTGINIALAIAADELEKEKRRLPAGDITALSQIYILTDCKFILKWVELYLRPEALILRTEKTAAFLSHPAFKEMARQLGRLSTLKAQLELHWIKGHSGAPGNTIADHLARRAAVKYSEQYHVPVTGQQYQVILRPDETEIELKNTSKKDHRKRQRRSRASRNARRMLQGSVEELDGSDKDGSGITQGPILEPQETISKPVLVSEDQVPEPTSDCSRKRDLVGSDSDDDSVPRKKLRLEQKDGETTRIESSPSGY